MEEGWNEAGALCEECVLKRAPAGNRAHLPPPSTLLPSVECEAAGAPRIAQWCSPVLRQHAGNSGEGVANTAGLTAANPARASKRTESNFRQQLIRTADPAVSFSES